MLTISKSLSVLLPLFYLILLFIYGQIFFGRTKRLENKTFAMLLIVAFIHGIEITLRGISTGSIPLTTLFDAFSFLAFSILIVYMIIEILTKNKATGLYVFILPFILQTISSMLYNRGVTTNPLLSNPIFAVHAVLSVIGYTAIFISALYALLYIMLNMNIKNHRFGLLYDKLPPLALLESMSIRSVKIGIILLGLGLLVGHFRAYDFFNTYWPLDPKVIISDVIWICYFSGFFISQIFKWRGRWMAYLSLSGFFILLIANILLKLLSDTFHQFN